MKKIYLTFWLHWESDLLVFFYMAYLLHATFFYNMVKWNTQSEPINTGSFYYLLEQQFSLKETEVHEKRYKEVILL